ncbi:MAG: pilus assembly protein PilM [Myxococcota bacterium]
MPQRILGVDVGAWSVKAVLVESQFRGFRVVEAKEARIEDGEPETLAERQADAIRILADDPELRRDGSVAALSADGATTRWVELPFADARRVDQVIEGELADLIPFPIEDAVFDHVMVDRTEDGSRSLAAAAPRARVRQRLDALMEAGVDPKFLPLDVLQISALQNLLAEDGTPPETPSEPSGEALTFIQPTPDGPPTARLIVDVGHERTLACAVNDEGLHFVRVLRCGGAQVTAAIAEAFELPWTEAETGKHADAFVASSRHPAPDEAAQRVSDAVQTGLRELVRELRRTLQAIRKERRVHVERIDLVGGGARIRNLPSFLCEQLNLPVGDAKVVEQSVERQVESGRAGAFALALAVALRSTPGSVLPRIDFRKAEFAFAGSLEHFRSRVPFMAASVGALLLLLLISVAVQYRGVVEREAVVDQAFCDITQEVVGREICEPSLALSVMTSPDSELGSFELPERSAYVTIAELSERVPEGVELSFEEIQVTSDAAQLEGVAISFDAVDKVVTAYGESDCLDDIKKARISKSSTGEGVEFELTMKVVCR